MSAAAGGLPVLQLFLMELARMLTKLLVKLLVKLA